MPLLLGPSGKLDLPNKQWVTTNKRRPLAAPGLDQAWLWHRGSRFFQGDEIPEAGSQGPEWFEPKNAWGTKGALARYPRVLMLCPWEVDSALDFITSIYKSKLEPLNIAVNITGGQFPFLLGCPIDSVSSVDQNGTFKTPVAVPKIVDPSLYRGGKIYVAAVTQYRTAFLPDENTEISDDDYTFNDIDADPFPGYDYFKDHFPGNPNDGFTVFTSIAADHRQKMAQVADVCIDYKTVFYQQDQEYAGSGADDTDSSLISDGALSNLLGGDTRLGRVPYAIGDLAGVYQKILADAIAFFS